LGQKRRQVGALQGDAQKAGLDATENCASPAVEKFFEPPLQFLFANPALRGKPHGQSQNKEIEGGKDESQKIQ
jgi:hypothetical protein